MVRLASLMQRFTHKPAAEETPPPLPNAPFPEMQLVDCSPNDFRTALTESGFLVLRNAIEPAKVHYFHQHFIDRALKYFLGLSDEDILNNPSADKWWGGPNSLAFHRGQIKNGYLSEIMLNEATRGVASYFDLISDPAIHALLAVGFPGKPFHKSNVAHCRRIAVDHTIRPAGWAPPVPFHNDLRYHAEGLFALNFWVPLEPAGDRFGSPALEIAMLDLASVARFLDYNPTGGYDPNGPRLLNEMKFERELFVREFGEERLVRPSLDVGDLMVFHCWTLHRTYLPSNVRAGRTSAEIRLAGDSAIATELLII
jgi:hypothetical protein